MLICIEMCAVVNKVKPRFFTAKTEINLCRKFTFFISYRLLLDSSSIYIFGFVPSICPLPVKSLPFVSLHIRAAAQVKYPVSRAVHSCEGYTG